MDATQAQGAQATIVDVSHWQVPTELDWATAVQHGLAAVIVKYTQGIAGADPAAMQHAYAAYEAGVPLLGGYHFGDRSGPPAAQAQHFLAAMRADYGADLAGRLVMLDLEGNAGSTMDVAGAEIFVQTVFDQLGRWPVLYMGRFGPTGNATGLPSRILSNCDLMLPAYGDHADLAPILPPGFRVPKDAAERGGVVRLWQFTDGSVHGGPFPGLGKVDQSRAIGLATPDQLTAWWGQPAPA